MKTERPEEEKQVRRLSLLMLLSQVLSAVVITVSPV